MLPIESSTLLRVVIFSAFVGFVLFCASYATHVWLKRNKGNRSAVSWVFKAGVVLVVAGLLGSGGSWALNRFVDRSGIVDGGALFVVHARRDGHVVMTPQHDVGQSDVIAEFHPPALGDQLKVIDSQIGEARARIDALHVRPVEIDPELLQKQEQLRAQTGQQLQFQVEFARARRDLERTRLDVTAHSEREGRQIANEIAAVRLALDGVQQQQGLASVRLARAQQLRKQGLVTMAMFEERSSAVLALALERQRLGTAIAGLMARLGLVEQQHERAALAFEEQRGELARKEADTRGSLDTLGEAQVVLGGQIEQDRTRAALRKAREIEVAQRQVVTLLAERGRAVAAHQIAAPFAGRVVYRNASPGLAAEGAAVLAVSTGSGFVASIAMPASEIDSVAGAGTVIFALDHPVLKKYFTGEFRAAETASFEPGRVVAAFDAQLPQDAIGLLGAGREPVKVRLMWQPPLLQANNIRTSLLLFAAGVLLMLLDRLRGTIRLPFVDRDAKKA